MKYFNNKKIRVDAPLYNAVLNYSKKKSIRFHMPSHKGNKFVSLYDGSDFDITELDFSDNLLSANGVIAKAEKLLAETYDAKNAFMFTSGATTGIFAALYVAKCRSEKIILSRNSHKSVYNALSVLRLNPCFCDVEYDEFGLPLPITCDALEKAIKNNPDAKSVFITSPDYFGRVCDLENIAKLCKDKLLIADSAHGAHFAFSDDLIERAELYCDITILSMHKTLPCFTGSALVISNDRYSDELKRGRGLFHTTSPYYPAMCSMDYARASLSHRKKDYYKLKNKIEKIDRIPTYDYGKLILKGGRELDNLLKQKNIYSECVFGNFVLLIVTPWDVRKLYKLKKVLKKFDPINVNKNNQIIYFNYGEKRCDFCEVIDKEYEYVSINEARGRIAATEIGLYPPGVPVIIRGEVIDEKKLKMLLKYKNSLFGVDSERVCVLK